VDNVTISQEGLQMVGHLYIENKLNDAKAKGFYALLHQVAVGIVKPEQLTFDDANVACTVKPLPAPAIPSP
jgi:hypothetical protein